MDSYRMELYLCLNCNKRHSFLYRYTEGKFIKLAECEVCCKVVDKYVECEKSIIITDLILQEEAAYKHVMYNSSNFPLSFYGKLLMCIVLSEAFVDWLSFSEFMYGGRISIKHHEIYYYIMCFSVCIEFLFYTIFLKILLPSSATKSQTLFAKSVILGHGGRLLNIPAIIFNQCSNVYFKVFISILVFSSSVQSTKALTFQNWITAACDVLAAFAVSYLARLIVQGICLS